MVRREKPVLLTRGGQAGPAVSSQGNLVRQCAVCSELAGMGMCDGGAGGLKEAFKGQKRETQQCWTLVGSRRSAMSRNHEKAK